jgi:hypothetical protein
MKAQLSNFTIPTPTTDQLNILVKNKPLTPQPNDRKNPNQKEVHEKRPQPCIKPLK